MNLSIGLQVKADVSILFHCCSPNFLHPQEHVSIKAYCLRYVSILLIIIFASFESDLCTCVEIWSNNPGPFMQDMLLII